MSYTIKGKAAKARKVWSMSEAEYSARSGDDGGICLACGSEAYGVEPDAEGYDCESCGERSVYGLEEALIIGRVELTR